MKKQNKKYRKLNLVGFTIMFALFSASFYLATTLFLRTKNNTLSAQKQNIEIQTLSTRERVDNIANENGLSLNQDNIVTIAVNSGD